VSILSPNAKEIAALAREEEAKDIQFAEPPSRAALETLEREILRHRSDFEVRFYGFYQTACDLRMLRHIPSVKTLVVNCLGGEVDGVDEIGRLKNLVNLTVGIECLNDFTFLDGLPPSLKILYLEEAKKKTLSLKPLSRFQKLRRLYVERHHKDLNVVSELGSLEELVLRSITVPSLSFLSSLQNLRVLDLKLGGTRNLDVLGDLANLKKLEIWRVSRLMNLDDVVKARDLRVLYLQDLPNVTRLPSFAPMKELREVHFDHLNGLKNIVPVTEAPGLEWFSLTSAPHCSAETLKPLLRHPTLKRVSVGLGSFRKNREVRALFAGSKVSVDGGFGETMLGSEDN
jgi:hypothetical protein